MRSNTKSGTMMRMLLVIVLGLATLSISAPVPAQARNPECRFGIESVRAVKATIRCVAAKLPRVGAPKAIAIARRETGLGQDEINDVSGACGIYQHYPRRVFKSRYREYYGHKRWGSAPNKCLHDRTNIIVSLTMVNRGGWGPWGG